MVRDDQDGMVLLAFLRANNGPWASFMCANGLVETFGWTRKRLAEARHRLVELGHIELLRPAATGRPAVYHHHHPGLRHERGRDDRTRRVGGIGRAPPAPHEWRDGDGRAPAAREEGRVTVHDARRAAGSRKRSEPRRRRASGALLPPERRVTEVVKIVGEDRRDNVAGVVSTLIELQDEAAFTRARPPQQAACQPVCRCAPPDGRCGESASVARRTPASPRFFEWGLCGLDPHGRDGAAAAQIQRGRQKVRCGSSPSNMPEMRHRADDHHTRQVFPDCGCALRRYASQLGPPLQGGASSVRRVAQNRSHNSPGSALYPFITSGFPQLQGNLIMIRKAMLASTAPLPRASPFAGETSAAGRKSKSSRRAYCAVQSRSARARLAGERAVARKNAQQHSLL
jgi:hypothetical protein